MKKQFRIPISEFRIRLVGLLLALVMLVTTLGSFGMTAFAAGEAATTATETRSIMLGTSHITGGQASNVYFGTYQQSNIGNTQPADGTKGVDWIYSTTATENSYGPYYKIEPIKWRVLSNADGRLFLLSDQNLDVVRYHGYYASVTWETSGIRSWLNNNFINAAFGAAEKGVIAETNVVNATGENTADKVFLLSIEEAQNTSYFANNNSRIATNTAYAGGGGEISIKVSTGGEADVWWLRTPGGPNNNNGYFAKFVSRDGSVNIRGLDVDYDYHVVRPAFNLNLSSVLFTSAASGGKPTGTGLTATTAYTGNEYKLTLLDSTRNFALTDTSAKTAQSGDVLSLGYTGATTGANEYISAMIVDANGAVVYYGQLAQAESASGTVRLTVPADIAGGNYTLKLFNEQLNGDYKTDYSGAFVDVSLTVCQGDDYNNGICTNCGEYEPATLNGDTESAYNGYYEIGNAGQLFWFAEQINSGAIANTSKAVLTADIDLENKAWTTICPTGLYYSNSYASSYGGVDTGYAGTFDGDGHVIKNLSVTAIANQTWTYGFFGTMTGTVKNLGIEGFTYNHNDATDMRVGAIVGQNLGGAIENCYVVKATITPGTNVAGGITGCNYAGTIRNCYVADSAVLASSSRYGYIAGDNRADNEGDRVGTIENCYTDGDRLVGSYTGTETNSKYGVNYQYFTNGGVVWYLNGQSADGIWKQGETHPNFTGTAVTQSLLSSYTQPKLENGAYQIATESELRWFAEYVNFTDASVSAVLTDNIVMADADWIPIGMYGTPFTGTFDGAEKSITNFKMTITEGGRFGLFGEISGAIVKNFSIDGEVTANLPSQQTFYYGVIGVSANSTITDVHSSVNLKVEDSFDKNGIAGIVANITTTTIERCSFSGTLNIGTAYVDCAGGIVGYSNYGNAHVIRDCAFYGEIIAKHESSEKTSSGQIGGMIGYYRGSNLTIENCLSIGTFDVANTTFTGMIGGRVLEMGANIGNVSNNYYYGDLPAFSNTTDSTHGYYNKDMADYEGYGNTNAAAAEEAQLASGEVSVLLGEAWGIGENGYPIISGIKAPDSNFDIYGQQLNLGGDLSMKYYVAGYDVNNLDPTKLTMKFIHNGVITTVSDWVAVDGFYVFTLTGINPQCMGDGIDAYLYYDGAQKAEKLGYTVEQNLKNLLTLYSDDAALVALINDILVYGEAASAYRDHKTMNGTNYADNSSNREIPASSVAASDIITDFTVVFGQVNFIKISVALETGYTLYLDGTDITTQLIDGIYRTNGIAPTEFDKKFTFEVRNGETVVQTFAVSVNDYIGAQKDSLAMGNLVKALYNYGISAHYYVGDHTADRSVGQTCLGSQCVVCGAWYGDTDANNHASNELTYTANADGTTHTKKYKCCDAVVSADEEHTITTWTQTDGEHTGNCDHCGASVSGDCDMDTTTGKCKVCGNLIPVLSVTSGETSGTSAE